LHGLFWLHLRRRMQQFPCFPSSAEPRKVSPVIHPPRRLWILVLLLLSVASSVPGCARGKGSITGKVSLNGNPVATGLISFHSEVGNREVFNAPIRDGSYTIEGVPEGSATITVRSLGSASPTVSAPTKNGPDGALPKNTKGSAIRSPDRIPDRYAD